MRSLHTLADYPLLLTGAAMRIIVLVNLIRYRTASRLLILRFYLAFGVLSYLIALPIMKFCSPVTYWRYYWFTQACGYLLQAGICISLINTLKAGTKEAQLFISCTIMGMMVLAVAHGTGITEWLPVLKIYLWADISCWFMLLWCLIYVKTWDWPYRGIALGLALSIALHLVCSLSHGNKDPSLTLRLCYQLASISGLSIWAWTIRNKTRVQALMASA